MTHLERLIEQLSHYGQTTTSIVLSSPIKRVGSREQERAGSRGAEG
ncbi:hypothetical protein [Chroococcidiopsis sp. CCNUC1]|nr:hypothetical protein [Chroococcidiopsis sp. CCNUC1]URD52809.1 hypothetical protein M5J74_12600 [Chroococcidiopsis sp. CCNUC1]